MRCRLPSVLKRTLLLALALTLVACGAPDNPGRRDDAAELADAFLRAAGGGRADRGWSLIHPDAQSAWGDADAWVQAAETVDWSGFDFTVLEARYCDDGVICPVNLSIPGGPDSILALISAGDDTSGGIVFLGETEGMDGNAELWVLLPDLFRGPGGISVPPPP